MGARRSSPRTFAHLQGREVCEYCPETTEHAAESSELVPAPLLCCPGQYLIAFLVDAMCSVPLSHLTSSSLVPCFQCRLMCVCVCL